MSHKRKVFHICNDFNEFNGLIETLLILSKTTDHDIFDLAVCVFSSYQPNLYGAEFEANGGRIVSLGEPKGQRNILHILRTFFKLYKCLKRHRPDIVQTYCIKPNVIGISASVLAGVPVICGAELTLTDIRKDWMRWVRQLLWPIHNWAMKRCDSFIFNSEATRVAWVGDVWEPNYLILYPPFDHEKYQQAIKSPMEREGVQGLTIGFVGRLSEQKGVFTLLKAMPLIRNHVPEARLMFVGRGHQEANLKSLSKELDLGSHVRFAGFKRNVFKYLRQMDVLVIPSRTEGFGMAALEAMSMGIPVIASPIGGLKEIVVDGETGLFVSYGSIEELSVAVVRLLSDRAERVQMGRKGRARAFDEFHPSKYTLAVEDLYLRLYEHKVTARAKALTENKH